MNNLAACVQQPQHFIVIFQAGGQGQLHVSTHACCNTEKTANLSFIVHYKLYLNFLKYIFIVINNSVINRKNTSDQLLCAFALHTIPNQVFLLIAADIVLHIEIPRDDNCNLDVRILWLCLYKWPWMGSETHTNCVASVCRVWRIFYWQPSADSSQEVTHTALHSGSDWTTIHGGCSTHIAPAV